MQVQINGSGRVEQLPVGQNWGMNFSKLSYDCIFTLCIVYVHLATLNERRIDAALERVGQAQVIAERVEQRMGVVEWVLGSDQQHTHFPARVRCALFIDMHRFGEEIEGSRRLRRAGMDSIPQQGWQAAIYHVFAQPVDSVSKSHYLSRRIVAHIADYIFLRIEQQANGLTRPIRAHMLYQPFFQRITPGLPGQRRSCKQGKWLYLVVVGDNQVIFQNIDGVNDIKTEYGRRNVPGVRCIVVVDFKMLALQRPFEMLMAGRKAECLAYLLIAHI